MAATRALIRGTLLLACSGIWPAAVAQAPQPLERVEITGSSLRRIDAEAALPVQVYRRADIERSGVGSVAEFLQSLPAMQGYTNEGAAVGGGGLGFSGASIHDLGEERTLVLLNGRRLAPFAGQYVTGALGAIDLNTLPLAAVERIEVLADGASAVYGADAIGGVVNIITRRDLRGTTIDAGYAAPRGGGQEKRVALTHGLGELQTDGFNLTFGASYSKRRELAATKRDFAKTGVIDLTLDGTPVVFFQGSARSIPANFYQADDPFAPYVNPFLQANGRCPSQHVDLGDGACYYDFVPDLGILPERDRGAIFARGDIRLGGGYRGFAELLLSRTSNTNRLPPSPGDLLIEDSSPFWADVLAADPSATDAVIASYRLSAAGRRTQTDVTEARHLVLGTEGQLGAWDVQIAFTHSRNEQATSLEDGYTSRNALASALDSGLVNPFVTADQLSAEAVQALRDARILGFWEGGRSTLNMLELRGRRELMALPGGPLQLAAGLSHARESFEKRASALARGGLDGRFGDDAATTPFDADRHQTAAYAELLAPLTRALELGAAVRHDRYSDFGSHSTGKLSARFQPAREWLLRGSLGTGIKAPTVAQVNATRQLFGVTGGAYDCDDATLQAIAAGLAAVCPPGFNQFNVYASGNDELQPEKSTQWTLGIRFEPNANWSLGADVWSVRIRDAIGQVDELAIFGDPAAYPDAFTTYVDPLTSQRLLAVALPNRNLGTELKRGVDLDLRGRFATPLGRLSTQLAATTIFKDEYQFASGGPTFSSLGRFGADGDVTFRWQGRLTTVLEAGAFAHTLTLHYKSSYKDQAYSADSFAIFDPVTFEPYAYDGRVGHLLTVDWQTRWAPQPGLSLTAGLLNVFDRDPPRSLKSVGGGFMLGYDDRYADPRGRVAYLDLRWAF